MKKRTKTKTINGKRFPIRKKIWHAFFVLFFVIAFTPQKAQAICHPLCCVDCFTIQWALGEIMDNLEDEFEETKDNIVEEFAITTKWYEEIVAIYVQPAFKANSLTPRDRRFWESVLCLNGTELGSYDE